MNREIVSGVVAHDLPGLVESDPGLVLKNEAVIESLVELGVTVTPAVRRIGLTVQIEMIDPFVLLHHYGPYTIDEESNPFDLGPHPHHGF